MPSLNPTTSKSGKMLKKSPAKTRRVERAGLYNPAERASTGAVCENIVGMERIIIGSGGGV